MDRRHPSFFVVVVVVVEEYWRRKSGEGRGLKIKMSRIGQNNSNKLMMTAGVNFLSCLQFEAVLQLVSGSNCTVDLLQLLMSLISTDHFKSSSH